MSKFEKRKCSKGYGLFATEKILKGEVIFFVFVLFLFLFQWYLQNNNKKRSFTQNIVTK